MSRFGALRALIGVSTRRRRSLQIERGVGLGVGVCEALRVCLATGF